MDDIRGRYDKLKRALEALGLCCHGSSRPQVAAMLTVASVLQEAAGTAAVSLNQLPTELKCEFTRLLAEQIQVRP